jgi:heat shock protein HslJ
MKHSLKAWPAVACLALAVGLATIGRSETAPATSLGPEGVWIVSEVNGHATPSRPVAHIDFKDGEVHASDGCNGGVGKYSADKAGHIQVGQIPFTLRACPYGPDVDLSALFHAARFEREPGGLLLLQGADGSSLLLRPTPPTPQVLEGDWVVSGAYPVMQISRWSYGKLWISFHHGVVKDSAGCVGRYSGIGDNFRVVLSKTRACAAPASPDPSVAEEVAEQSNPCLRLYRGMNERMRQMLFRSPACAGPSVKPLPVAVELTEEKGPDLLSRLKIVGIRFREYAGAPELVDASGALVDLSAATPASLVPPGRWTVEGRWRLLPFGPVREIVFAHGIVDERGGCRGRYQQRGEAITFSFPAKCQARMRAAHRPGDDNPISAIDSGRAKVDLISYGTMDLRFDNKDFISLDRVIPKTMLRCLGPPNVCPNRP